MVGVQESPRKDDQTFQEKGFVISMKKSLKVASLFSGCGGLDLGFIWAGFNVIWANDNMKDACQTYIKNIGNHIVCKDIQNIKIEDIPKVDVVIGGPPCQGFSGIGKRDPKDKRSSMVWSYLDVIRQVKPTAFVFENVIGITSAKTPNGSRVIEDIVKEIRKMGYRINVHTLNAADYGVPQRRKRLFIIGNSLGINITRPNPTHSETSGNNLNKWVPSGTGNLERWVSAFEAISDLGEPSKSGKVKYANGPSGNFQKLMRKGSKCTDLHIIPYASKKDTEMIKHVRPGGNYLDIPDDVATKRVLKIKRTGGRTTNYGRLNPEMPCYTLNTYFDRPNVGCNIHYGVDRMITIREGLRLQSFPDSFEVCSSSRRNYYVQVGNAVPPLLSFAVAKQLKSVLLSAKNNNKYNT